MSESEEAAYELGGRAAWLTLLCEAKKHLGHEGFEREALLIEREEAIMVLKRLCGEFGDLEWDENLHLADIIDKHLGRYIEELADEGNP